MLTVGREMFVCESFQDHLWCHTIRQPSPAHGLGYWPAFWMLGAGFRAKGAGTSGTMACLRWSAIGEIDVLEDVNALSKMSGTSSAGKARPASR